MSSTHQCQPSFSRDALLREFENAVMITCASRDGLSRRYGLPVDYINGPTAPARFGLVRGLTEGRHWQPHPTGRWLMVTPEPALLELDDPQWPTDELVDLIAFDPRQPTEWWTRTGCAQVLNEEAVFRAEHYAEPLHVHEHPLAWLRAGGRGVVVLDWSAHLPLCLSGPPSIHCTSPALAERLDKALHRPPRRVKIEAGEAAQCAA